MTKNQLSLLLYLETRLVDHSGRVDSEQMNDKEIRQADRWNNNGLIGFGRIASEDCSKYGSLWVTFSDEAWKLAHTERRARAAQLAEKRTYQTTAEKREA